MPSGSVSLANSRLSLVDGTAFVDFSAAGTLTPYLNGRLTVTDSAGKKAVGYIKAAGTGETLGDELVTNGTFTTNTTGWAANGAILSVDSGRFKGVTTFTNDKGAYQNITLVTGGLYKFSGDAQNVDAYLVYGVMQLTDWSVFGKTAFLGTGLSGTLTAYGVATGTNGRVAINISDGSGTGKTEYWDNVSLTQQLTPSATGATITSTRGGTTYDWESVESGFNFNDSAGYSYTIALAKRSFNFGFGWDF
jgi:hypothetical protein